MYDVIVIGAGPSGLMAAIAAAEKNDRVLLLEKGKKPGNKLSISGGGRCNVTNRLPIEEIIAHIPGNGRFLYGAFSVFTNEDIIRFFENLQVPLKEEDHGRMFPVSNKATDVVQALLQELKRLQVDIRLETPVADLIIEKEAITGVQLQDGTILPTSAVILATGGKAVPKTGSTGDAYPWAEKAGHTITPLYPTEVPLLSSETFIQQKVLQGVSLRDVAVSVLNKKGKPLVTHQMDMIFTHRGVSGPAILRCSQFVVKEQMKTNQAVPLQIDHFPYEKEQILLERLIKHIKDQPKRKVHNALKGMVPEKFLLFLLERAGIDKEQTGANCTSDMIRQLARLLKKFTLLIDGTEPLEKAFVTGGGVRTKEINPKTMQSKLCKGLSFCGELIDVHGYTGGYNITAALITGRVAGLSVHSIK